MIESENCNFLKYGRIGKHPIQSLNTGYYVPCDYTLVWGSIPLTIWLTIVAPQCCPHLLGDIQYRYLYTLGNCYNNVCRRWSMRTSCCASVLSSTHDYVFRACNPSTTASGVTPMYSRIFLCLALRHSYVASTLITVLLHRGSFSIATPVCFAAQTRINFCVHEHNSQDGVVWW